MRSVLWILFVATAGCGPKVEQDAGPSVLDDLVLSLDLRSPLQCSTLVHEEATGMDEQVQVTGCRVEVTWELSPLGRSTLTPSTFVGADVAHMERRVDASAVAARTIRLVDAHSEGLWDLRIPEDDLPWRPTGDACARPDDDPRTALDLSDWRFLVIKVWTRDPFGNVAPYVAAQDSSLDLVFDADLPTSFRPKVRASSVHDGTWLAMWCADAPTPSSVAFNVRGAGQLTTRTVELPPEVAGDTITALEYYVDPSQHVEASR